MPSDEVDNLSESDVIASDEIDDVSDMVSAQVGGWRPFSEIVNEVEGRQSLLRPFSEILNGQS